MYKVIVTYELAFLLFWNILYMSNSGVENWFTEKFLTAIFVFFSTMALGATLVYVVFISLRMSGISKVLKNLKDPRKNQ
jgi:predicted membrane protein